MYQKKVVLASVLKPINDTRMYEKIGVSLASTSHYDVNIIGFQSNTVEKYSKITFHPIFNFKRLSFARIFCGYKYYKHLKKISPHLIIINTHELLFPTMFYKILHKSKVIYDVQENYYRNLKFTDSFPKIFRPILAIYVRGKEYFTSSFIDHFLLAEKHYPKEISFIKKRYTILENKCKIDSSIPIKKSKNIDEIKLIFSGTLAESTGVFGAIELAKKLHEINEKIRLTIIGYTPKTRTIKRIKKEIFHNDFITLKGGEYLINHTSILTEIRQSDFGIIYYPLNKSTINTTPTKLYEYLTYELPILIQDHKEWESLCDKYNASITVNFEEINSEDILNKMKNISFYPNGVGSDFLWLKEEEKLFKIIDYIIS
ncbi:MAG: glycosyltransferase [Cyclobacteriaceae bacterium]|nr:glycosyltransferase [Cyclobacteriaceae bacterium]